LQELVDRDDARVFWENCGWCVEELVAQFCELLDRGLELLFQGIGLGA
jgi:hypothetical protein